MYPPAAQMIVTIPVQLFPSSDFSNQYHEFSRRSYEPEETHTKLGLKQLTTRTKQRNGEASDNLMVLEQIVIINLAAQFGRIGRIDRIGLARLPSGRDVNQSINQYRLMTLKYA